MAAHCQTSYLTVSVRASDSELEFPQNNLSQALGRFLQASLMATGCAPPNQTLPQGRHVGLDKNQGYAALSLFCMSCACSLIHSAA